jgi:hypothetical protein
MEIGRSMRTVQVSPATPTARGNEKQRLITMYKYNQEIFQ